MSAQTSNVTPQNFSVMVTKMLRSVNLLTLVFLFSNFLHFVMQREYLQAVTEDMVKKGQVPPATKPIRGKYLFTALYLMYIDQTWINLK